MTRRDYQLIGVCLAHAFTQCEESNETLSIEQANIIMTVFCELLQQDRPEFDQEMFVNGVFEAANQKVGA